MNIYRHTFLLLVFLILSIGECFSQLGSIQQFTQVNGLPSNQINRVYEDSRGIVWLATDAGLCEFNGSKAVYRRELSRLQGERINGIVENAKSNLVIAVNGDGLYEFDGKQLSKIKVSPNSTLKDIHDIAFRDDKIYVGTSAGLYVASEKDSLLQLHLMNKDTALNVLQFSFNQDLLVFRKNSLANYRIDKKKQLVTNAKEISVLHFSNAYYGTLKPGSQLLIKDKTYEILDTLRIEKRTYGLLRCFNQEIEHRKLIVLENGICKDLSEHLGIHPDAINCIVKRENSSDLILGTKGFGLLHVKKSIFTFYQSEKLGFGTYPITDIAKGQNNRIWIASNRELVALKNGRTIKRITTSDFCNLTGGKNCNKEFVIYALQSKKQMLWIATNFGFFSFNANTSQLKYRGMAKAKKFVITQDHQLFCFTESGFESYSIKDGKPGAVHLEMPNAFELEVSKISTDKSDIWVATKNEGIIHFNSNHVDFFNRDNSGIHNVINDLILLSDKSIIAGGNNGMIYKLAYNNGKLTIKDTLDEVDGLRGISVHGFQYLPDSSLWCGTNAGVYRFDYQSWHKDQAVNYRFWNSTQEDFNFTGLQSIIDTEGNIWVNSGYKLMKIKASDFRDEEDACRPILRRLKLKQHEWKNKANSTDPWTKAPKDPIQLDYFENNLSFQIGMQYCENPDNVRFRYRLRGLEDSWSDWSRVNEAVYSNLKAGDYLFEIESRQLSSNQISSYSTSIIIAKAWWTSYWAIGIFTLLIILASYFLVQLIRYKIRREEKGRTKQFNRVIGLKIKALQNQLDPHFICNSLNSIQSYILNEEEDKALEYLSDFSMILRKNINDAQENVISLKEELAYLQLYLKLEQMRFEDKFDYQILVDEQIDPVRSMIPPMLIQPFLAHAIQNGLNQLDTNGKLKLHFSQNADGSLQCIIEDNGVGNRKIEIDKMGNGHKINSLQITVDRMKLLNKVRLNGNTYQYSIQEINDSKNQFTGVRTVLNFPKLKAN